MPQQTVYIRNEDMAAWKALENKAQFIHDALGGAWPITKRTQDTTGVGSASPGKPKETPSKLLNQNIVKGSDFVPKPPDPELGYPCCQGKRPCKHWSWDVNQAVWVNSITRKTRENDL